MRFENPWAFQLFWLIPIILLFSIAFERRGRMVLQKALGKKLAPFLSSSVSKAKRRLKLALRLLTLSCFILALSRPQMGKSLQEVKVRGVEMIIALDVSLSMLSEDVKPSRLQYAKSEAMRLLDMLSGDKVGLIAFAGSATMVSPLTTDTSALKMFIESLSPESVETQGTDIHRALGEAAAEFDRGGTENDEKTRVTKVILLLSDGEDHEEKAIDDAKRLSGQGIRIFTVAFGTERGAPIPIRDERGFLKGYKRDKGGKDVLSQVHGDFLKQLAIAGRGTFHHATFGGSESKLVKEDLDKLEKAEFASNLATNYDERYQIPLAIGILLAFLEMLIGERKSGGRLWRGRFEVAET